MPINDLLSQATSSTTGRPVTAQLTGSGHTASGTSVTINVATNWPTTTVIYFSIFETTTVGTLTVKDTSTQTDWKGTLSGTTISNMTIVGGTDRDYSAGVIVELTPIARQWKDLYDFAVAEHNQDGTHSNINATSLSVAENIDVVDGKAIRDGNNNELLKFAQTASAVNELTLGNAAANGAPYLQASGGDTNINTNLIPKGTGKVTKSGNPIDWWEEIGRATLGSAGDTITVSSIPVRRYLRVIVFCADTGGTISAGITFNNDTGSNYANRRSDNGGADATATSSTSIPMVAAVAQNFDLRFEVENTATLAKVPRYLATGEGANGAGNAPNKYDGSGKWHNTSDQITRIDVINAGTGDFNTGSQIIVLGHD